MPHERPQSPATMGDAPRGSGSVWHRAGSAAPDPAVRDEQSGQAPAIQPLAGAHLGGQLPARQVLDAQPYRLGDLKFAHDPVGLLVMGGPLLVAPVACRVRKLVHGVAESFRREGP